MMKKFAVVLTACVLSLVLAGIALADGEYANAGALYQAWFELNGYEQPYPEYITGVWSADGTEGNLVFGVTKDERGEAGKEEILRLVADDATISFTYQSYSYAELYAIQQEIIPLMGDEYGIYACGVYDMENVLKISIDETNPKSEKIVADLFAKYGDRIAFEEMDGRFVTLEDTRLEDSRDMGGEPPFLTVALGLLAVLLAVVLPVLIRKSRKEAVK